MNEEQKLSKAAYFDNHAQRFNQRIDLETVFTDAYVAYVKTVGALVDPKNPQQGQENLLRRVEIENIKTKTQIIEFVRLVTTIDPNFAAEAAEFLNNLDKE